MPFRLVQEWQERKAEIKGEEGQTTFEWSGAFYRGTNVDKHPALFVPSLYVYLYRDWGEKKTKFNCVLSPSQK